MVVPASQLPDGRNLRKLTTASPTEGGGRLLCSTNNADKTETYRTRACVCHTHTHVCGMPQQRTQATSLLARAGKRFKWPVSRPRLKDNRDSSIGLEMAHVEWVFTFGVLPVLGQLVQARDVRMSHDRIILLVQRGPRTLSL